MIRQVFESPMQAPAKDLFAWHASPGAFERLCPPWQRIAIDGPAPVANGSIAHLRMKKGPIWVRWTAEHRDVRPGRSFVDVQTAGPFRHWHHLHDFLPTGDGSMLRDQIDYELPAGALGRFLAGGRIRRDLATTFAYRHETTARDLARHALFQEQPRLRIAVSGAGGLVGSALTPFLTTGGHQTVRLVRTPSDDKDSAAWSPAHGLLHPEALGPLDALVHLAGENVAGGRWTAARKKRIRDSRVEGTRNLVRSLAQLETRPKTLICASAIGYYGSRADTWLNEDAATGEDFLAEVCRDWEEAAAEAAHLGIRVVMLRFGVILSPAGGALAKMLPPFKLGGGGVIGDGRQYMSWVSIDDVVGAIYQALHDPGLNGPVNVCAPEPVTNRQFTAALGSVLRRPTPFPMPKLAARAAFGEMADAMLLASARVKPQRLQDAGFRFDDADLERTLARLLGKLELRAD